jgi:uncharacterized Zn finger protein
MAWYYKPYVSAAQKAAKLEKLLKKMTKAGHVLTPVKLSSKVIAHTFWGKAWCENLERYSDMENRLPRGRTYVRKGSVVDLKIGPGSVSAMVSGSELYDVVIEVAEVPPMKWKAIQKDCAGGINSLVELLQGRLSQAVMQRICEPNTGLFPKPAEIKMRCSCPDFAAVCKHIAAVIYGIGARLDQQPELLFRLRKVDENELIATANVLPIPTPANGTKKVLASDDLSALFGLEMAADIPAKVVVVKTAGPKGNGRKRSVVAEPMAAVEIIPTKAKRAAARKVSTQAKKGPAPAGKKPVTKGDDPMAIKKIVVKKIEVKKPVVKQPAVKKPAVKKSAGKKIEVTKATVDRSAVKRPMVQRIEVKKPAAKKAAVKKSVRRKSRVKGMEV